jgi:hypothetical protein
MDTNPVKVAGIEAGRAPSNEPLKRLAAALNVETETAAVKLSGRALPLDTTRAERANRDDRADRHDRPAGAGALGTPLISGRVG